ncbi:uncharacterized protein PHALS_12113 [Plasmopara halstedii]|uniref:Uncharacterized protein n=1 Tax=Plasmopara halstedii TaxID=4781 RepID=A0A0N7L5L2_PLAHL|nr:uncharacterized protein PHALS_12113 [Plasmopara halstedii]CEG41787.1 hypothetical protein PHALS_12113 [Plasmopara halstedii]|eukprot:XP_024578156.1 hypothetical protein PHALS_12113 [Plasmopara halstedii]
MLSSSIALAREFPDSGENKTEIHPYGTADAYTDKDRIVELLNRLSSRMADADIHTCEELCCGFYDCRHQHKTNDFLVEVKPSGGRSTNKKNHVLSPWVLGYSKGEIDEIKAAGERSD